MTESVLVSLKSADGKHGTVEGTRVCFSVYQCFAVMDEESRGLLRRLADHLRKQTGLALWNGPLLEPLLEIAPDLRGKVQGRDHGSGRTGGGRGRRHQGVRRRCATRRRRDGVPLRHARSGADDGGRCIAADRQGDRRGNSGEHRL